MCAASGTAIAAQLGTSHCLPLCWVGAYQQVGSAPERLSWGPTAQIMAASCADGLYLCQKLPLHHKLADGYAAVQVRVATTRLVIEHSPPSGTNKSMQRGRVAE